MNRGATILTIGLLAGILAGGGPAPAQPQTPAQSRAAEPITHGSTEAPAQAPAKKKPAKRAKSAAPAAASAASTAPARPQTPAQSRAAEPITHGTARTPAAAAAPVPKATLLSVKDVMRHIINPAAETYWAHSGEVDDEKGANDRVPTAQADWNINIDTAATLAEAGNLLMMDGRARDPNGPWMKYAQALNAAGIAGMAAASAHDHDKTNDAGSAMYDACFQCHGRYIPRPKDSLYKHDIDKDLKDAGVKPPK